jgi:DNA invertase Pin-like site-specific DNA recombinase
MRAYGYVRVSTAEQASNDDSLDTQKQQITGYAMMKGWEIAQFFVEGGVSGSVPLAERPEGQRLLAGASKGDVIITSRLDRAFRSAADALATLEELKADGVASHDRPGRRCLWQWHFQARFHDPVGRGRKRA